MNIHATAVALAPDRGLLILGASGAGKSSLALRLMAFGAHLVADDRVDLHRDGQSLWASPPPAIAGKIEARGAGILQASALFPVQLLLAADLSQPETERLPPQREISFLGLALPLVRRLQDGHLEAVLLQWLKGERLA